MAAPPVEERVLIAPEHLDLESRIEFRREAVSLLQAMREGAGRLVVDLSSTRSVDSAGLGTLILVQRRAARRRQVLRLRGVSEELHHLLVVTKLQNYFEVEGHDAG